MKNINNDLIENNGNNIKIMIKSILYIPQLNELKLEMYLKMKRKYWEDNNKNI